MLQNPKPDSNFTRVLNHSKCINYKITPLKTGGNTHANEFSSVAAPPYDNNEAAGGAGFVYGAIKGAAAPERWDLERRQNITNKMLTIFTQHY